ncbi:MAG: RluA family pseudouridine synthase [Deltaproteobacteria bacterium]|nr:RluA family pseudouridine synthase [Deltaproteobacteria bacterium]
MNSNLYTQYTQKIAAVCDPLPGSIPYESHRPLSVKLCYHGWRLLDLLADKFPHISEHHWQTKMSKAELLCNGAPTTLATIVKAGDYIETIYQDVIEPYVDTAIEILYDDDYYFIINKPAPLPVHACGRYNKNTVVYILSQAFALWQLRPVHRLDANTTGVLILAKTKAAASAITRQFEEHKVYKTYLACVCGHPSNDEFVCEQAITATASVAGRRDIAPNQRGVTAHTVIKVLRRNDDETSLVEVTPRSGRTNQIRLHLAANGHAIVSDQIYQETPTESLAFSKDTPIELHAWKICFIHFVTDKSIQVTAQPPSWA